MPDSQPLPRFLVILEVPMAARLPPGRKIEMRETGDDYSFSATLSTIFPPVETGDPLPGSLQVHAELERNVDLEIATGQIGDWAAGFANIITVGANAATNDGLVICAIDRKGPEPWNFYQAENTLPQRYCLASRSLPEAALQLYIAIHARTEEVRSRLVRACQNYALALRYWHPRTRALSLMHLAIAGETLRDASRDLILSSRGITKQQLKDEICSLGIAVPEIRRPSGTTLLNFWLMVSQIYFGDADCYTAVSKASNEFEHGYGDFTGIKTTAATMLERTAAHIRNAIIDLSGLSVALKDELLTNRFTEPIGLWTAFAVRGTMLDNRPPVQQGPPLTTLSRTNSAVYNAKDDSYNVTTSATLTVAKDVSIKVDRIDARH